MNNKLKITLEKRIAMLEQELANDPSIKDDQLHNEFIDLLNTFIRELGSKFNTEIGNTNNDKMLKKTKSFKLIKALKEVWVNAARK